MDDYIILIYIYIFDIFFLDNEQIRTRKRERERERGYQKIFNKQFTISLLSIASCVSNVVSCLAGGDGLDDDWIGVLPPLCVLLEDLVGGGGGSQPSLRPPLKLNPLRLLGNGGRPCREDIAILSCMLKKARVSFNQLEWNKIKDRLKLLSTNSKSIDDLRQLGSVFSTMYKFVMHSAIRFDITVSHERSDEVG